MYSFSFSCWPVWYLHPDRLQTTVQSQDWPYGPYENSRVMTFGRQETLIIILTKTVSVGMSLSSIQLISPSRQKYLVVFLILVIIITRLTWHVVSLEVPILSGVQPDPMHRLHSDLIWCYEIGFGAAHRTCNEFFEPKIVPHTTEHS